MPKKLKNNIFNNKKTVILILLVSKNCSLLRITEEFDYLSQKLLPE